MATLLDVIVTEREVEFYFSNGVTAVTTPHVWNEMKKDRNSVRTMTEWADDYLYRLQTPGLIP